MEIGIKIPMLPYVRLSKQQRMNKRFMRMAFDFPEYSNVCGNSFEGQVIGYYAKENCGGLKVRDRNGFVGFIPSNHAKMIYYCAGVGCYNHVEHYGDRCPSCRAKWNAACDAYRRCRAGAKDDADLQNRLNEFASGRTDR